MFCSQIIYGGGGAGRSPVLLTLEYNQVLEPGTPFAASPGKGTCWTIPPA